MKRISNYALDCFTLKVMALTVNKLWCDKHFNEVIKCAESGMSAEDAAKEIDKIKA